MSEIKIEKIPLGFIGANCYFVTLDGETAIIDPGLDNSKLAVLLEEYKGRVKYILLTHRHADHLMGLAMAKKATDAKVAIHAADQEGCFDSSVSLSRSIFRREIEAVYPETVLHGGEKLPFGNGEITVIHTPGHTLGSVCFIIGNRLFSGDTVFLEEIGRCDLESANFDEMLDSLRKLSALDGDFSIYPGHGENTTLQHERERNPYFIKAAQI